MLPLRVEVRARRGADRSGDRAGEVGQDVPEQVGGDDHVVVPGVQHEVGGECVDELTAKRDIRVPSDGLPHNFVPERHGMHDAVALRRRGELAAATRGELRGESYGAGHSMPVSYTHLRAHETDSYLV